MVQCCTTRTIVSLHRLLPYSVPNHVIVDSLASEAAFPSVDLPHVCLFPRPHEGRFVTSQPFASGFWKPMLIAL